MAIHADSATAGRARLSPYRTDYTSWKILAWTVLCFCSRSSCSGGLLRTTCRHAAQRDAGTGQGAFPRFPASLSIALSICVTMTAFYMSFSVAVARVMERVEIPTACCPSWR